jgi:hypothetical protein
MKKLETITESFTNIGNLAWLHLHKEKLIRIRKMGRSAEDSRTGMIKAVDQILRIVHDRDEDEVTRLGTAYDQSRANRKIRRSRSCEQMTPKSASTDRT